MRGMFRGCQSELNGIFIWDKVTTLAYFYDGCRNLIFTSISTRRMNKYV